jgi:alpha-L-rhamnosidase
METRGGIISSSWIKTFDEFVWQVIVPVNTRARLRYPAAAAKDIYDDGRVIDQVEGIQILGRENGNILMELGSGDYFFSSKLADIKPGPRKFISNP